MISNTATWISIAVLLAAQSGCTQKPTYPWYEPTPAEVVAEMLKLGGATPGDVVYDLGSGDGRIVIAAVKDFGAARGVGVELDEKLVALAESNARKAGVADKVSFVRQDLFKADIATATVVTLYLLPETNLLLRPKLQKELKPGARIVSNTHDMGDWRPERTVEITDKIGEVHRLHLWTVR